MGERILVVDDNPVSAEMLSSCLGKFGSKTVVRENGEECLAEVVRRDVSMIFLEVAMPGMSGLDVLVAIRREYDSIELPIVMVSNLKDDKTLAKAMSLGANDFLHKPIDCIVTVARIYRQLIALDLYKKSLKKKRNETINSMVATYNHEINNTLAVAVSELNLAQIDNGSSALNRVSDALKEISTVIRKIKKLDADDIEEADYLMGEKMIKLRKEAIV